MLLENLKQQYDILKWKHGRHWNQVENQLFEVLKHILRGILFSPLFVPQWTIWVQMITKHVIFHVYAFRRPFKC